MVCAISDNLRHQRQFNMRRQHSIIILAALAVSVLVRLPVMNRPLSKHHEFNAAMVLNVCQSWQLNGGPTVFGFCPLIYFGKPGDAYYDSHFHVKDNKVFYLSFGPGQFLLPYAAGQLLNQPYTPLLLQILAILLHIISTLFLWRIVPLVSPQYPQKEKAALLTALLFLFTPITLWFFGNGYVHESAVLPFVLAALYCYLKYHQQPKAGWLAGILVAGIAGIFTDWLMVFVMAALTVHGLMHFFRQGRKKEQMLLCAITGTTVLAGMSILYWAYSSYFGTQGLADYFRSASAARQMGGGGDHYTAGNIALRMLQHLGTGYGTLLSVIPLYFIWGKRNHHRQFTNNSLLPLLFICTLLYFLAFAQFSAEHDYSALKFSYLFAIVAGLVLANIRRHQLVTTAIIAVNVLLFYFINRPGSIARNGDRYAKARDWGMSIAANSQPDECIAMPPHNENHPAIMYYAQRNIFVFGNDTMLRRYQQKSLVKKFCVVRIEGDSLRFQHTILPE
jgi:hypothetical protein